MPEWKMIQLMSGQSFAALMMSSGRKKSLPRPGIGSPLWVQMFLMPSFRDCS
jgi:hypothetical protein